MSASNVTNRSRNYNGEERRVHTHLRANFAVACRITLPFLDKNQGFGGLPMKLSALRELHNCFPELTEQDVAILFSGVQNYHGVRLIGWR
ncbi:MAG: hypothetical protein WA632_04610 [Gallionella sp.]